MPWRGHPGPAGAQTEGMCLEHDVRARQPHVLVEELPVDPVSGITAQDDQQGGLLHVCPAEEEVGGVLCDLPADDLVPDEDECPGLSIAG